MLTVLTKKTMSDLPMLPSMEMRFSLVSRLSFRGLGQALLAVGDILSSCNIAEMFNSTRYSYSQLPDKQAEHSILALKLQAPPTGNSCFQTACALHTQHHLIVITKQISTWERIIGIYIYKKKNNNIEKLLYL